MPPLPSRSRRALAPMLCVVALVGGACTSAQRPESGRDSASAPSTVAPSDGRARVAQLERDARALARVTGCSADGGCRVAPVGWKACGGPRDFVAYCAASTDTVALFAALERLKRAEMDYNAKSGMMSTCEMRLPPAATLVAGRCSASR